MGAELIGKTTAWEYYFNRLRPNSYQQNRSPYQRMLEAGVDSKTAEQACLWTVTILDNQNYQNFDFNLSDHGYDVCSWDASLDILFWILQLRACNFCHAGLERNIQ